MSFPKHWTDIDKEIEAWSGWPAPLSEIRNWATPANQDYRGSGGDGQGRSLRTDIKQLRQGVIITPQYTDEAPRTMHGGGKKRIDRIKALGNAVVPQQAYPLMRAISIMNEVYTK